MDRPAAQKTTEDPHIQSPILDLERKNMKKGSKQQKM